MNIKKLMITVYRDKKNMIARFKKNMKEKI